MKYKGQYTALPKLMVLYKAGSLPHVCLAGFYWSLSQKRKNRSKLLSKVREELYPKSWVKFSETITVLLYDTIQESAGMYQLAPSEWAGAPKHCRCLVKLSNQAKSIHSSGELVYFLTAYYGWTVVLSITMEDPKHTPMFFLYNIYEGYCWTRMTLIMLMTPVELQLRQGRQQALGHKAGVESSSAHLWPRWA